MAGMFKLPDTVKGIFPYDYYTMERYIENIGNITEAMEFLPKNTREEFVESLNAAGALIDGDNPLAEQTFDMYKFALFYCR